MQSTRGRSSAAKPAAAATPAARCNGILSGVMRPSVVGSLVLQLCWWTILPPKPGEDALSGAGQVARAVVGTVTLLLYHTLLGSLMSLAPLCTWLHLSVVGDILLSAVLGILSAYNLSTGAPFDPVMVWANRDLLLRPDSANIVSSNDVILLAMAVFALPLLLLLYHAGACVLPRLRRRKDAAEGPASSKPSKGAGEGDSSSGEEDASPATPPDDETRLDVASPALPSTPPPFPHKRPASRVAGGGNAQSLPASPTGRSWRVHRFTCLGRAMVCAFLLGHVIQMPPSCGADALTESFSSAFAAATFSIAVSSSALMDNALGNAFTEAMGVDSEGKFPFLRVEGPIPAVIDEAAAHRDPIAIHLAELAADDARVEEERLRAGREAAERLAEVQRNSPAHKRYHHRKGSPGPAAPEPALEAVTNYGNRTLPHIVLVGLESLNGQYFLTTSPLNGAPVLPHLDAFAHDGAGYSQTFYSPTMQTSRSQEALLCGAMSSFRAKMFEQWTALGQPNMRCLPHVLKELGYETLAWSTQEDLGFDNQGEVMRLMMGFDHVESMTKDKGATNHDKARFGWKDHVSYQAFFRRFDELVAANTSRPVFAYFSSVFNHFPFTTPRADTRPPFTTVKMYDHYTDNARFMLGVYETSCNVADRFFGENFVTNMKVRPSLYREGIVVVTGDHSSPFSLSGRAPLPSTGSYEENFRVPLAIRAPGRLAPGPLPVNGGASYDIAPTILHLLGARTTHGWYGTSLLAPSADSDPTTWMRCPNGTVTPPSPSPAPLPDPDGVVPAMPPLAAAAAPPAPFSPPSLPVRRATILSQPFGTIELVALRWPYKLRHIRRNDRLILHDLTQDAGETGNMLDDTNAAAILSDGGVTSFAGFIGRVLYRDLQIGLLHQQAFESDALWPTDAALPEALARHAAWQKKARGAQARWLVEENRCDTTASVIRLGEGRNVTRTASPSWSPIPPGQSRRPPSNSRTPSPTPTPTPTPYPSGVSRPPPKPKRKGLAARQF